MICLDLTNTIEGESVYVQLVKDTKSASERDVAKVQKHLS